MISRTVDTVLPDKCHYSLLEISFSGVVGGFYCPYKCAGRLIDPIDLSIPAFSIYLCRKQELAPAIVDIEIFNILNAYCNRPQQVILPVIVWSKGRRDKNGWFCFKDLDSNKRRIFTALRVIGYYFVLNTPRSRWKCCDRIGNIGCR